MPLPAKKWTRVIPNSVSENGREVATQIAIGALRFFMLKYTKPSVIAFDFKDALSFEGETGPYVQYAVVRASNIFRKGGFNLESLAFRASDGGIAECGEEGQAPSLRRFWKVSQRSGQ